MTNQWMPQEDLDEDFRVVVDITRHVLRSLVFGAMSAWTAYISTGLISKAAVVGISFCIVSGFASLRRWFEAPVVILFILAMVHWCDDGRFSIITKLANSAGLTH